MKTYPIDQLIDDIYREKNKVLSLFLDKYSLGNGQFQILNEIAWHDGISQEGIASIRKTDKSAIAKSIKGLIDKGYIFKERNLEDKRAYCLHCTEKGRLMIPKIQNIVESVDKILLKDFSKEDASQIRSLCLKLKANIATALE
ncbi:MAG: MarR family transcriptional regulator [Sphaerochaetaceae bacterium]|nr:MarR family transcriptional regulator [Sphaerochaetaceae bacterium]MDC7237843.1 MarR family transcriptional regulator [Sphaerochaetaceae bacterium]MDC7243430.1 MarR family transcriptional regulator [Sphaerochaetaceae bacterium]MDC7249731.1 MarR family transcriptional regulator [Sphaerochaetaceae bacterium]